MEQEGDRGKRLTVTLKLFCKHSATSAGESCFWWELGAAELIRGHSQKVRGILWSPQINRHIFHDGRSDGVVTVGFI